MSEWQERTLSEVVDHIERRHHAFLRELLPRLEELAEAALGESAGDRRDAIAALRDAVASLRIELEHHLLTEESAVFPLIRGLDAPAHGAAEPGDRAVVAHLTRHLETEHRGALDVLAKMRRLTSDYTPPSGAGEALKELHEALKDLDADLREHIRLETLLFERAGGKGGEKGS